MYGIEEKKDKLFFNSDIEKKFLIADTHDLSLFNRLYIHGVVFVPDIFTCSRSKEQRIRVVFDIKQKLGKIYSDQNQLEYLSVRHKFAT